MLNITSELRYQRIAPASATLVTVLTAHRRACLDDPRSARCIAQEIGHCGQRGWLESLAWVVMPEHLHWLLRMKEGSLNAAVAVFKSRSERAIQLALGRPERIWQAGYHDRLIREAHCVMETARHIVANPLRRGLVERIEHYPYFHTQWPDVSPPASPPALDPRLCHPP